MNRGTSRQRVAGPLPSLGYRSAHYGGAIQLEWGAPGSLVGTMASTLLSARTAWGLDIAGLVASLAVLAVSGDQFIVALARIAGSLRVRPTVAAALVGGLGTSVAELVVAGVAARTSPALAVGSLAGSISANVCLGLAVAALVTRVSVDSATVRREAPLSVGAVGLFAVLAIGSVTRAKGAVMLAALLLAVAALLLVARRPRADPLGPQMDEFAAVGAHRSPVEIVRALVTLAVMLGGAELMVASSIALCDHFGISRGFAGLTLVGVGTSAPLIAASVQAARRGEHDLVVGNVLGGNLFIALGGGAIVGLVGHGAAAHVSGAGLGLMLGVVVASWLAMARGSTLVRSEAWVLIAAYAVSLPFLGG